MVVWKSHENVDHEKMDVTLNEVCSNYLFIKNLLRKCVTCNAAQGKPILPPSPPNLPGYRVSYEYPFEATGLDQAGPFYVRDISNNEPMN